MPPENGTTRREELLAVATKLFAARGYHGTRMDDVADVVGLNKATVYHYYASKSLILFDIYRRAAENTLAAVHDDPWPLEPVDLARVPDDVQEKVAEIDEQLVAVCTRLSLEPEHITIARRLLVRVAERDPQALRRRGAIGGWVAGLIVVVGDMNRLIGQRHGQVTKKAIAEAAGVKSVGDKDITIGRAAQLMSAYHHVDLLDSRARQHLLELLAGYED